MTVSRKIVDLWQVCQSKDAHVDVFDSSEDKALQSLAEYGLVYDALEKHTDNPHMAIVLTLRALEIQRSEIADQLTDTELAVTAPPSTCSSARPTLFVIREMIESARREIILAGYRITNTDIIEMLWSASRRGVKVLLVCGRADGDAAKLKANWPIGTPQPKIYEDVDSESDSDLWSLMHIKSLLVDSHQLLVSSANFTAGGMDRNIEFGIRTTGKPALEAKTVLMQLIRSDLFCEVPMDGSSS